MCLLHMLASSQLMSCGVVVLVKAEVARSQLRIY